ncbi:hypothetical protein [Roseateles oligotrophus]|uniref:Uncharacterized protein n=1 Tax=Roseateles oligotrophus TaxID=1769250 RepID=A0ABT2YBD3_9BURK|nr:hypothetical protein [Roseateles oligotrophus]MCV2367429.1 hypothetical protein [Roseateles oligotrophus]
MVFGPEEDPFTRYEGDPNVIAWLKDHINQCTNGTGASIDADTVDPLDFAGFCQSDKVMIFPPFSALQGLAVEWP